MSFDNISGKLRSITAEVASLERQLSVINSVLDLDDEFYLRVISEFGKVEAIKLYAATNGCDLSHAQWYVNDIVHKQQSLDSSNS